VFVLFDKVLYLYSKLVTRLQYPSIRDSKIDKTSKIGSRSNVVRLTMGKYSYMGNNNSIMDTNIGSFCSIASYCAIGGGSHPLDWVSTSPVFYFQHSAMEGHFSSNHFNSGVTVNIGNDVWVGENCFINSGISIGNGAVIGAHSVVTKDIPDYAIAVGSPAIVIKYRFESQVIEELLRIKWWNFDDEKLKEYGDLFNNPIKFIEQYKHMKG
jgi:acetyltransferase-like isoleucine patch superfamily enzyme